MAAVRTTLDETPPELVADSMEHAIRLAGGALLKGLDRRIAVKTRMPVHTAEDLLACMACGAGTMAEELPNPLYRALLAGAQPTRRLRSCPSGLKTSKSPDGGAPSARRRRRTNNKENIQ